MQTKKIKCDCRFCSDALRDQRTIRVRKVKRQNVAQIDILVGDQTLAGSAIELTHYKLLRLQEAIGFAIAEMEMEK